MECKDLSFLCQPTMATGFNRDIVECKDRGRSKRTVKKLDLIETLWNVKRKYGNWQKQMLKDLIWC